MFAFDNRINKFVEGEKISFKRILISNNNKLNLKRRTPYTKQRFDILVGCMKILTDTTLLL